MAEKRRQEEGDENLFSKRQCVENSDFPKDLNGGGGGQVDEDVAGGLPASWGSQGSSSDSSGSSSSASGHQPGNDSSSEGSITDSLDIGLGDIQPISLAGPMGWLQKQMISGTNPKSILMRIIPPGMEIPDEMDEFEMWSIIAEYLRSIDEPPPRQKLEQYNTFDDAIQLLKRCKNILVLTGAGVSVSCGIPDFRSRDGVYARLAVDFPDLPDPQAMFEISYFRKDPRPFYKFAKELFPGQFKPSTSHKFISLLEQHNKLLRNYTQNIDTLEQCAGITRIIQCHGSFATATCTRCDLKVDSDAIREDVFNQDIPICPKCGPDTPEMAVLKPDIVFFGEGLPNHFYDKLDGDKETADLLIVMGSSLKVRPVATIPSLLPKDVPQILINREPLHHLNFDIELLGDCDVIINEILHRLGEGWNQSCQSEQRLTETTDVPHMTKQEAKEEKADVTEGESDQKLNIGVGNAGDGSASLNEADVTTGEELPQSLSVMKQEIQDAVDDKCKEPITVDNSARLDNSVSPDPLSTDTKPTAVKLEESANNNQVSSEPHCNGVAHSDNLQVCATPTLESQTNDSAPLSNDRLQVPNEKEDSALVCNDPQPSNTSPESVRDSKTHNHSVTSAESYMLFQRTLDAMGTSTSATSSSGEKVGSESITKDKSESCKPHMESDHKHSSADVKIESSELCVNESDRTNLQTDMEEKTMVDHGSSSNGGPDGHQDQTTGSELKPSTSTSAPAKPLRETIATHLPESSYLFIPPMRYVFHGAEVYISDEDDQSEHGLEGLPNGMDMNALHDEIQNDLENDLHNTLDNDLRNDLHDDFHEDFHSDLHNGDDLPDLLERGQSSAKEKIVSLDDLIPTVPLTNGDSLHHGEEVTKVQCVSEVNGREGSPFEAPAEEAVFTSLDQPVTP